MSRGFKNTSGGKQISGGVLSPRTSERFNTAGQIDSLMKGISKPSTYTIQYFIVAGGRSGYNQGNFSNGDGAPGGDGAQRQTVTGAVVNTGQTYTITVGAGGTGSFQLGGNSSAFGTTIASGSGGNGTTSSYSGTSLGYGGYGGHGGSAGNYAYGAEGTGQPGVNGGGNGGFAAGQAGQAGRVNSGGGGGGGGGWGGGPGAGGSGTVIIQYLETLDPAETTTGSPTVSTSGGYRIYNFTGSGSITF